MAIFAAAARRTMPGPASTMYVLLSTTIATAGPERVGSAFGVPVPSRMTWLRRGGAGNQEGAALDGIAVSARHSMRVSPMIAWNMRPKLVFVGSGVNETSRDIRLLEMRSLA